MRKVLFLLLFLLVLGAASVSAQVRIGGDGEPNAAAVLDLNEDDATDTGTKGLALPRVSLSSDDVILPGVTENLDGMLVYNTSGSLPAGVYFWNGSNWIMGSTDTIPGGGLTKTLDGKVGVKAGGITTDMLADSSVLLSNLAINTYAVVVWAYDELNASGASRSFSPPAGCSIATALLNVTCTNPITWHWAGGNTVLVTRMAAGRNAATAYFWCFK